MSNGSLIILGRQPELGMAELESLLGAENVYIFGDETARLSLESKQLNLNSLGGSRKLCTVLSVLKATDWTKIQNSLEQAVLDVVSKIPSEGKLRLGLSLFGMSISPQAILATGLQIKRQLRQSGRSVRLVPNQERCLNSAQVLHNQLTGPNGCEFVIVQSGDETVLAKTVAEQDIESYALRDRSRPKRDAKVGMLPPKLAQIIVNLAAPNRLSSTPQRTDLQHPVLLDPFCGTGVVLQEGLLMEYDVYGTDLEDRMIDYVKINLDWLRANYKFAGKYELSTGDATSFQWDTPIDFVASETYLGSPFTSPPSEPRLSQTRRACNTIIEKFLINIASQLAPGTRLCLAIPAWQQKPGQFVHLPLLDHLNILGYNRISFEHVRNEELLYFREDQYVARELLVMTRK